ncbi:MAG: dephospho-CoA kinase [Moraxellaceae bacterium]
MFVIGLTGGIGSGKTLATDHFARLGITIVDADVAARIVVAPGQPALAEIAEAFGADMLLPDGQLDRPRLRQRVFSDPEARRRLEAITHPRIAAEIARQLGASQSPYTILVSPLLFESGQVRFVQRTLLIDADPALQRARAAARDNTSPEQIDAIMAAQMSREERQRRADDILLNNGEPAALHAAIEALHARYLELARGH